VLLVAFAGHSAPELFAGSATALVSVAVVNREHYVFVFRQRGMLFAAACISLELLLYFLHGPSCVNVRFENLPKQFQRPRQTICLKDDTSGAVPASAIGCLTPRGNFIIMGDADDNHDFTTMGPFEQRLREGYDVVMGNRF
jgi:hypothetical protein